MGKPGSRSFPAVVIYNVDCDDRTADEDKTVIFEREETSSDDVLSDEVNMPRPNGKSVNHGTSPALH